jgi:1-acyl-sn-glycerol-3-phosphate acyltransferase
MQKIVDKALYLLIKSVIWVLMHSYFRLHVEGMDNVPKEGPFIVASNHASFLDAPAIQLTIPQHVSWIAKQAVMEKKALGFVHRLMRSIALNGSIKKALDALTEEKRVLGIFPEGTRTRDGKIDRARTGAAVMALKTGSPVVPVGIKGTYELFPANSFFPRPGRIHLRIGRPIPSERRREEKIDEALVNAKTDEIMKRIRELAQ